MTTIASDFDDSILRSLYVVVDNHENGLGLPDEIKNQNNFINRAIDSNASLYKESFFLDSWLLAYGAQNERIIFLRFFNKNYVVNSGCFAFVCLKVNSGILATEYINGGILFGYPGPAILPGNELAFLFLLRKWLSNQGHFYRCKIGPTRDRLHELPSLNKLKYFSQSSTKASAPYIDICSDFRPHSSNLRQNLRTKSRLLDTKEHEFYFCQSTSDSRFPSLFDAWIDMLTLRWPNGHFAVDLARQRYFHLLLANELTNTNSFLFAALILEGQPASIIFGILQKDRYYYFNTAMDLNFQGFAPAQLLIQELVKELPKLGVVIFDFMNDMEPYKLQWAIGAAPRFEYEITSHFFMRSKFKYRWSPKLIFARLIKLKNLKRIVLHPRATLNDFWNRG